MPRNGVFSELFLTLIRIFRPIIFVDSDFFSFKPLLYISDGSLILHTVKKYWYIQDGDP